MAHSATLGQQAECQRCGLGGLAKDLTKDGRNPQLLVLKTCGCYDPPHPAEHPYVPKPNEGKARFPVSPELYPAVEIELDSGFTSDALVSAWAEGAWAEGAWAPDAWEMSGAVGLVWGRPVTHGARIERYEVWRSFNDGPFALITTTTIVYSDFAEIENDPEDYVDTDASDPGTYRYYVEAVTGNGRRHRSNTTEIEVT